MLYKYNQFGVGRHFRRRTTLAGRNVSLGKTVGIAHDLEIKEAW